jgi:hypothetical protein
VPGELHDAFEDLRGGVSQECRGRDRRATSVPQA